MADLSLRIKADFEEASRQFKALAETSEDTRKKIEKYTEGFNDKKVDEFIDKQKLAGAAITATTGSLAAAEAQNAAYKREIERLIKNGLDPQSDAIKKLISEQKNIQNEINNHAEAQKRQEAEIEKANKSLKAQADVMKFAERAALACFAAIGASIAALGAMTQKTAEAGDAAAKAARTVGLTAEAFQELQYAAKSSGVDDITPSLQKLNKTMADVKNGSGALTNVLKNNNKELLNQLQGAKSNEQAFNLLMNAIKSAPDEFSRAELATAAFGKAGNDLIKMAMEGTDGIGALREESRKYGIISNEAAKASEDYMTAQSRLKAALTGVQTELTAGLLPGITKTVNGIAEFIAKVDDWDKILKVAGYALAGVTVYLTTFIAVSKGHAIITTLTGAIRGLMAAVTGPAGIAVLAITGIVAAISALVALDSKQIKQGEAIASSLVDQKNKADQLLTSYGGLNPAKKLDEETTKELIRLYPQLSSVIRTNETTVRDATDAVKAYTEQQAKDLAMPFIDKMKGAHVDITLLNNAINTARANAARGVPVDVTALERQTERLALLRKQYETFRNDANAILNTIGIEVDVNNFGFKKTLERAAQEAEVVAARIAKSIAQILSEIPLTEGQLLNQRIDQVKSYLNSRADLERTEGEARIRSIQSETRRILADTELFEDERRAIIAASAEAINEIRKKIEEDGKNKSKNGIKVLKDELAERVDLIRLALSNLIPMEKQINDAITNNIKQFLNERADMEGVSGKDRIAFIQGLQAQMLADESAFGEYRVQIEAATNELILQQRKALNEQLRESMTAMLENSLNAITGFLDASLNVQKVKLDERLKAHDDAAAKELANEELTAEQKKELEASFQKERNKMIDEANKKAHRAAVAQKAIANAEAVINTFAGASKALSSAPPPINFILMGSVIAAGLANVAKINTTPIPKLSAETGGRFIVPDLSPHTDGVNVGLRATRDEVITVEPRGESGGMMTTINLIVDNQVVATVFNKLIKAGEINLRLAGNL